MWFLHLLLPSLLPSAIPAAGTATIPDPGLVPTHPVVVETSELDIAWLAAPTAWIGQEEELWPEDELEEPSEADLEDTGSLVPS